MPCSFWSCEFQPSPLPRRKTRAGRDFPSRQRRPCLSGGQRRARGARAPRSGRQRGLQWEPHQKGAEGVFSRGRAAWTAPLPRLQPHRDHRDKPPLWSREALPALGDAGASRSGHIPPAAKPGAVPGAVPVLPMTREELGGSKGWHRVPSSRLPPARALRRPCCRSTSVLAPMPH